MEHIEEGMDGHMGKGDLEKGSPCSITPTREAGGDPHEAMKKMLTRG